MTTIPFVLDGMNTWLHGVGHHVVAGIGEGGSGKGGGSLPGVNNHSPNDAVKERVQNFLGDVRWVCYAIVIVGVMGYGAKMGLAWQNGGEVKIGQFAVVLLGAVVIAAAPNIVSWVIS